MMMSAKFDDDDGGEDEFPPKPPPRAPPPQRTVAPEPPKEASRDADADDADDDADEDDDDDAPAAGGASVNPFAKGGAHAAKLAAAKGAEPGTSKAAKRKIPTPLAARQEDQGRVIPMRPRLDRTRPTRHDHPTPPCPAPRTPHSDGNLCAQRWRE